MVNVLTEILKNGLIVSCQPVPGGPMDDSSSVVAFGLAALAAERRALVAFETPHRLTGALADIRDALGDRRIAVCREMTKLHEEVRRGSLDQLARHYAAAGAPKGEVVIVVASPERASRRRMAAAAKIHTAGRKNKT